MTTSRTKVYELAKELGVESQNLVDVVQRLGIDVKNTMSILGTEEVRTIRDHYRRAKPVAKAVSDATAKPTGSMTEKRVGATVIRRRAKKDAQPLAEEEAPEQLVEQAAAPEEAEADPSESQVAVEEAEAPERPTEKHEGPKRIVEETPGAPTRTRGGARKAFPSIIKKVGTEEYLGETIGPKVDKKEVPVRKDARPGDPKQPQTQAASTDALGIRKVREVELAQTDAAKDAGRRRLLDRQSTIFKSADFLKRELVHATKKRKTVANRPSLKTQITTMSEHKRVVEMQDTIKVSELAKAMSTKASGVIGKLMNMGVTATVNQSVDLDTATLVAHEFGFEVKHRALKEEDVIPSVDTTADTMKPRAPVVTIMGHVDHGKTSLLDNIRKSKVAAGEAGGITQHVGAYTVKVPKGKIAFIDTPGHEAFTAMRARGAKVTDIVVLVVSATDGVMPQTLESISHAKAAGVPIIVAVNKIDLPDATPDRVKQTLVGQELTPEEWGGDTIYANVSAKTGQGVDKLLESILLQAELLELKANYDVPARATVVESRLDKAKGPLAWVLVQHGTLRPGDLVVCGTASGKIRAMSDSFGKRVTEAGPSDPVEILGLSDVPVVGDSLAVVEDEKKTKELLSLRVQAKQKGSEGKARPTTLEEAMGAGTDTDKELRVILRADVQGSSEALKDALLKFPQEKVKMKLLHVGSGGITESDVMLARASRAVILGFNIRPDVKAQKLAEQEKVTIRTYNIIYELLDDVKKLLEGLLDKIVKEKIIGRAEVRDIFQVPKVGTIAGSAVIDGKVTRSCFLRLLRDSRVIYEGKVSSLRRFKDDVKEVAVGFECGIGLENFNDLKPGDQFEAFVKEESQGSL